MLLSLLFLAISSSIDSLGIGISCGINGTKLSIKSKILLFAFSFCISLLSVLFGDFLAVIFSQIATDLIGITILIFIGLWICIGSFKNNNSSNATFFGNSTKNIVYLAITLSLDSFCIGISTSLIGINNVLYPLLIALFQFVFLTFRHFFRKTT